MTEQDELFCPLTLLSKPLKKAAQARNAIGEVAARFAAAALKLDLLPIQANLPVCPDFEKGPLVGEIKSVGKSNYALIFKWRLEKELKHHDPARYLYVFVKHACPISCADWREVVGSFGSSKMHVFGCTLGEVHALVAGERVQLFRRFTGAPAAGEEGKAVHGSMRKGYADGGWHFNISKLPKEDSRMVHFPWLNGSQSACYFTRSAGWIAATEGAV